MISKFSSGFEKTEVWPAKAGTPCLQSFERKGGTAWQLLIAFFIAAVIPISHAGTVVLDGKFGTSGALSGPNYDITAGMGRTVGNNLFHSFSHFNLSAGDVATFSGPAN